MSETRMLVDGVGVERGTGEMEKFSCIGSLYLIFILGIFPRWNLSVLIQNHKDYITSNLDHFPSSVPI